MRSNKSAERRGIDFVIGMVGLVVILAFGPVYDWARERVSEKP